MKHWLNRIVESGFLPTDDPDIRLKKVALTLVPLIIGPVAFLWGTIYFLLGHPLSGAIPMSYAVISAFSLAYFFKTKQMGFIQYSQLSLVLLLPFLLMWSLGGFAHGSMVMIWAIFTPVAALMFMERESALKWFLAYVFLILFSAMIDNNLSSSVTPLPEAARSIFYILNMGFASAGLFLLVSYSINEERHAISSLNSEIRERKQFQAALESSKEHAESLSTMLRVVLDTIPVRIFWKDAKGVYLGCNRLFAEDARKTSPDEIVGKNDYDMSWKTSARHYRADDLQVMNTQQAKLNFEEEQVHDDGSISWLRTSKVPLRDANGKVVGVLGLYDDISDKKAAEQALILARDEANRANRAKSEFLSSMSHELRTPMNAILGFSQLLDTDKSLPEEDREYVHEILKAGNHLLELINEVLNLAKIEAGHINLSLEPVEICPILKECMSLVGPQAAKHGVQITQQGPEGIVVRADRTRLRQSLLNLMSNAVKYNREGGRVALDLALITPETIRISVVDNGPGISQEHLGELFQPFNRLGAENSNIEGAGIGLTITKRIVEMMGGKLGVTSELGVGTTFWIDLPVDKLRHDALDCLPPDEAGDTAGDTDNLAQVHATVLYIDDTPSNLKLVAQLLGRYPFITLMTAETPELGIHLAANHHPDLILLDINLPGMDGYEVLEILRADATLKATPMIAVTANAMSKDVERGMAAGFNEYLTKPINVGRLVRLLSQYLKAPDRA